MRIFLLTDGQVNQPEAVINLIKDQVPVCNAKVFSFGIGNYVDKKMVSDAAEHGRGKSYFISNLSVSLKSSVINALNKATYPSCKNCRVTWSGPNFKYQKIVGELFKNEPINNFIILSDAEFAQLTVTFSVDEHCETKAH